LAANYEIRTVDGAGNVCAKIAAKGPDAKPAKVFDDAPGGGFTYNGDWKHQTDLLPAHAETISQSNQKGAVAELVFEGKKVLLFAKLGDNSGKAAVSIDGAPSEVVDTYSADGIWGVCVYRKELAKAGRHTLRIEVLGERSELAKDVFVCIDGVRVEPE
jgi:hypothetical protein